MAEPLNPQTDHEQPVSLGDLVRTPAEHPQLIETIPPPEAPIEMLSEVLDDRGDFDDPPPRTPIRMRSEMLDDSARMDDRSPREANTNESPDRVATLTVLAAIIVFGCAFITYQQLSRLGGAVNEYTVAQGRTRAFKSESTMTQQRLATLTRQATYFIFLSATPTPTATATRTPFPTQTIDADLIPTDQLTAQAAADRGLLAFNTNWHPVIQDIGGVPMVLVPPGCFMMNLGRGDSRSSETCLNAYWIDQTEVTWRQFAAFQGKMAASPTPPSPNHPVTQITSAEAQAFCEQRGGRLPLESEWEYAARGPDSWIYPWGNEWDGKRAAWWGTVKSAVAVGEYPDGASWVGALDMVGNVMEWAMLVSGGTSAALRGGSFQYSSASRSLTAMSRAFFNASSTDTTSVGFRCVRQSG